MNERIEKLVIEAGFPKFDKMYVVTDGEELEKFAELVVRECANIAYEVGLHRQTKHEILRRFGLTDEN